MRPWFEYEPCLCVSLAPAPKSFDTRPFTSHERPWTQPARCSRQDASVATFVRTGELHFAGEHEVVDNVCLEQPAAAWGLGRVCLRAFEPAADLRH